LNAASPLDHIQALYRLLLIRTGQRNEAENAIRQIFSDSLQKAGQQSEKLDFAEFFRTALSLPAIASGVPKTDLEGWPLALHQLPEPDRSAITLFYLEIFSPAVLADILGVDINDLARIISTARKSLEIQRPKSNIQI
jgi:DNA-directed RNA polymerase specialized sigma24 family protein